MHPSTQHHLVSIHAAQLHKEAEASRLAAKAVAARKAAAKHDDVVSVTHRTLLQRAGAAMSSVVPGHRPVHAAAHR